MQGLSLTRSRLGAFIRARRDSLDLTQDDLAAAVHTKRSTIEAIENGRVKQPSVPLINGIAAALGVPVEDLLDAMGYAIARDVAARAPAEWQALEEITNFINTLRRRRLRPFAPSDGSESQT